MDCVRSPIDVKQACPCCGKRVVSLRHHRSKKPECRPSQRQQPDQRAEPEIDEDLQHQHFERKLRARAAELLQHLRYDKFAAESLIDELKPALAATRREEIDVLRRRLLPLLKPGTESQLDAVLASFADPFYGLSTAKRERDHAINEQKLPVLEPRVRNLRQPGKKLDYKDVKNHGSVGISIIQSLARLMQNDAQLCAQIIAASDQWKEGGLHNEEATVFGDVVDGQNFRRHKITRKAEESEVDTVRVGLQLYNDGVTVRV